MCGGASTTVGPSAFSVEMADGVDGLGIGGQQDRLGVHQAFPDHHLLRLLDPNARRPSRRAISLTGINCVV